MSAKKKIFFNFECSLKFTFGVENGLA
jgi:hypothetical protein